MEEPRSNPYVLGLAPLLALSRSVLLDLARRPRTWLAMGAVMAIWPLWLRIAGIGITTSGTGEAVIYYEVAFLALLAGTSLATATVQELEWALETLSGPARLTGQTLTVMGGACVFLAVSMLPPVLFGRAPWEGGLALRGAAVAAHLAGLALLLLALPLPNTMRPAILPVLAWAVPSWLTGDGLPARTFLGLFDASAPLRASAVIGVSTWSAWPDMISLCALVLAAALIDASRHPFR